MSAPTSITGPVLAELAARVAELTGQVGRPVDALALGITERTGHLPLAPPDLVSPNGSCHLVQAADGWMAVNLSREEDIDLLPAWLGSDFEDDPWSAVAAGVGAHTCAALVAGASLLGLPAAAVGEVKLGALKPPVLTLGRPRTGGAGHPLRVVDLSALWAGPLCGAVLAAMGAEVIRIENTRRPDPGREATPSFFQRLHGAKTELALNLAAADGRARLAREIGRADILITGSRPRGLASLGLGVDETFRANPRLTWVAVSGYGWTGSGAGRVAFGDDAAAAGGLIAWDGDGRPRFLGDALADPLTGLAAAAGALEAVLAGGGRLVDAALARTAAGAAAALNLRRAA